MTVRLQALCLDARDPRALAGFWGGVLGWEVADDLDGGVVLLPGDDTGFRFRLRPSRAERLGLNRMHLDLTSASWEDQAQTVARVLDLGGRHLDVGQLPEEEHVVLADPEGNEFCVCEPTNGFLADCGFVGAVSCDGSQAVGYFWSRALGWPLVWDQDEETAIRAPYGGPKLTWGGPPVKPRTGRNRLHFDLAAAGDPEDAVARLVSLGATRIEGDLGHGIALADPDGNELYLASGESGVDRRPT